MKYFIFALALLFTTFVNAQCLKLDLVVVGDLSGSTYEHQYEIQYAFQSFVDRFDLNEEGVNISFVVFGQESGIVTGLTDDKDKLYNGIQTMFSYPVGAKTSIAKGLITAYSEILYNGREDAKKIIVFISDGVATVDVDLMYKYINLIKADPRVTVCGVLINSIVSSENLMFELSDEYCYVATDYHYLQETLEKMSLCL